MRCKSFERELVPGYRIHCHIRRDQTKYTDCAYLSHADAVVFDKQDNPVGFFEGHILNLGEIDESGENLALICDGHNQSLSDLYCYLLDDGKELSDAVFGFDGDLFNLDRLWIKPEHRGKNLGLSCFAALLVLLQRDCGLATMKPFPLQWEGGVDGHEAEFEKDRAKLISHYRPLEFIRVPDADEHHYRHLRKDEDIFGFSRRGWIRVNKIELPPTPDLNA